MDIEKTRKKRSVHVLVVEVDNNIYQGMQRYCEKFGRSKRWLVEDALNCWIIQRDMEEANRQGVVE
jgi:hypothetical protein